MRTKPRSPSAQFSARVPVPRGLAPLPHQRAPLRFILSREHSYLWADMGTGKTPIACMAINALSMRGPLDVIYTCPPELALTVKDELEKWCRPGRFRIFDADEGDFSGEELIRIAVARDSVLHKARARFGARPGLAIIDEAHRFKNLDTGRTAELFPLIEGRKYTLFLSGTAVPNGDATEIFPAVYSTAPDLIDYQDYRSFAARFCFAKPGFRGMKFFGIRNPANFWGRLAPFVFRLEKKGLGLPERIESLLIVGEGLPDTLAGMDRAILAKHSPEDLIRNQIGGENTPVATYRRLLGSLKARAALPAIRAAEREGPLLVFAYHREVVRELRERLRDLNPVVIDGEVKPKSRKELVREYQENPKRKLFIGNYRACGVGFTLTKANRVIFVEFDWVPGANDQAADRAHRVGQTRDVSIQYVVFKNSVDRSVVETLFRKRKFINTMKGNGL